MPDIGIALTEQQQRELAAAAKRAGLSPEEFASRAVSQAVTARYRIPSTQGRVLTFQALKSDASNFKPEQGT